MKTVTLNGQPMHLYGELPKPGSQAPNFALVAKDLSEICLHDYIGKRIVLNIFPSLDTDVCAASVRHFNKQVSELENTVVLCVSADLPFAAARFCTVNGIDNVHTASTFRSAFGRDYGVELVDGPLRGLMSRVVIVIDEEGKILGSGVCAEIAEEPDYDFVKNLLTK
ncbi:MAG: thiol peroxidase [Clostridium sp.]|nr:thiol peroxidase [Prevotella sp.]MCM1428682.1 thiol peroxidase [Clostridium sp.]MCM1475057.1 thiol peroxidase [Muribaculaceae bacterium]